MNEEVSDFISKISSVTDSENTQALDEYISSLNPLKIIELACNAIMSKEDVPINAIRFSFILLQRVKSFFISDWKNLGLDNEEQRESLKEVFFKGILSGDIVSRNCASVVFAFYVEADKKQKYGFHYNILDQASKIIIDDIPDQSKIGFIFALKEMIRFNILSTQLDSYELSYNAFIQYLIHILSDHAAFGEDFLSIIKCYNDIIPFYSLPLDEEKNEYKEQLIAAIRNCVDNESNPVFLENLFFLLFIILKTCYKTILENMEDIFSITISSFSRDNEYLVLPAIHFWKEVAEFEFGLINEDKRRQKLSKESDIVVHNIISTVSQELIAPIAEFIIKTANENPPDDMEDDVVLSIEASETLISFSRLTSKIFEFVQNNFDEMVVSEDWQVRYAAIILSRCITGGPNEHDQVMFFTSHFEKIISMINDLSSSIKDAVLCMINEIFTKYQAIATDDNFFNALEPILRGTSTEPYLLASRACDIITTIGKNFRDIKDNSSIFEKAFPDLIDITMKTLDREDAPLSILGSHCSVAIASLIRSAPTSHENLIATLLKQLNEYIRSEISSQDIVAVEYIQMKIQYLSFLIWSIIKRLGVDVDPFSEPILQTFLVLLTKKSQICQQDGLLALAALVRVIREKIKPYVPKIIEIFIISQESKMKEIIEMSAYLIHNLFLSIGDFMAEDEEINKRIVSTFLENLCDENVDITAKIQILNALSVMVITLKNLIGSGFTVEFVEQLSQFQIFFITKKDDLDDDVKSSLCQSILNGYKSLIEAAAGNEYTNEIIKNYSQITTLFQNMTSIKTVMSKELMKMIIMYIETVLSNHDIKRRVNTQLCKRCVKSILEYISTCKYAEIAFDASKVLEIVDHC